MINEIDPRIYNFKNLKLEDQVVVASQFKIFLLVKKEKEDLKETADKQNSLTKFLYEVAIEELDEVEEKIKVTIIQTIISFIENYDYFVKELETDENLHYVGVTRVKKAVYFLIGTERYRIRQLDYEPASDSIFLSRNGLANLRNYENWI